MLFWCLSYLSPYTYNRNIYIFFFYHIIPYITYLFSVILYDIYLFDTILYLSYWCWLWYSWVLYVNLHVGNKILPIISLLPFNLWIAVCSFIMVKCSPKESQNSLFLYSLFILKVFNCFNIMSSSKCAKVFLAHPEKSNQYITMIIYTKRGLFHVTFSSVTYIWSIAWVWLVNQRNSIFL